MGGGAALAVLAAAPLLALAGVQQDQKVDLRVPGTFQHGQWQGRCFRDGYLSGMDHELCRGWTNGPVAMHFERTAEAMRVSFKVKGCPRYSGRETALPDWAIKGTARAGGIAAMLDRMARATLNACHSKLRAPVAVVPDLEAMLIETEGLEAGSMK